MTWLFSFLFPWLLALWLLRALAARVAPQGLEPPVGAPRLRCGRCWFWVWSRR
jgi:hypothetical protein